MTFAERVKKVQEEAGVALRRAQEVMKRQVDRQRKEGEEWKKEDKVMLSMKDLVFKEQPVKKLVNWYIGPYIIDEVMSTNVVRLRLPTSMRIHLVVNISWVVWYREQVEGQKVEEAKPVKVEGVEEWEVERILNKQKIRGVVKYLVWWKGFTAEYDTWEKEEDLGNSKEVVAEFDGRMNAEVRQQERLDIAKERDFRREELLGKYIAKILYGWDDGKFEEEYLRKLERDWQKWKLVSPEKKPWRRDNVRVQDSGL